MGTVSINGNSYPIHGTLGGAQQYLEASIGSHADAWRALVAAGNDDQQGRLLVAATRVLYTLNWQGTPTVANQKTAFPRDGVEDVADGTTPDDVVSAEYELAALAAANPSVLSAMSTGSNVKKMTAGPVDIEYFRPTDVLETALPLPKAVYDLIAKYFKQTSDGSLAAAYGVDPCDESAAESQFEDCDAYERVVR